MHAAFRIGENRERTHAGDLLLLNVDFAAGRDYFFG